MGIKQKIVSKILKWAAANIEKKSFIAAQVNRYTSDWIFGVSQINKDIKEGKEILLARSRDAAINDPYVVKYIRTYVKNVCGPEGFKLRVKSYDLKNGKKVYDNVANTIIQEAFEDWGRKYCTIKRNITFRMLCQQIIGTMVRDGEVFIRKVYNDKYKYGISLQVIETEYCPMRYNVDRLSNGNYIYMGIEYDGITNEPVKYYFYKNQKINQRNVPTSGDLISFNADQIIHLYDSEFVDQARGYPIIAPVLLKLHHLNSYEEAILMKARAVAATTGVIERKDNIAGGFGNINNIVGGVQESDTTTVKPIEPLEPFIVPDGYIFREFDPKAPTGQEGPFIKHQLRSIASGLDISYITLASDYESVNYTSSRTALLDERDTWELRQLRFIEMFLEPVFESFLFSAIMTGKINLPISKFDKFNQPWFYGRRWKWVNPVDEVNANAIAIQTNQATLEDILAERGLELEDIISQKKYEKELIEAAGLNQQNSEAKK